MSLNIGKELTRTKLKLISEALTSIKPDIFCIAEGSRSKVNCQNIINEFKAQNYVTYYSPLFSDKEELKPSFAYDPYGLKIFYKSTPIDNERRIVFNDFSFTEQRENGRIVVLKAYFQYQKIAFVFLHNK